MGVVGCKWSPHRTPANHISQSMPLRHKVWIFINIALIAACGYYASITTRFDTAGVERSLLALSMGVLGLGSLFTLPSFSQRGKILAILGISALARLVLLPTAASDDINRYLWEGKLTSLGISPYQDTADSPIYSAQRDEYWQQMNHKDKLSAYPPLAMLSFRSINALSYSPLSYKIIFMVLDLFLIAVLLALLHHHARPLRWALFYALSPVSLIAFSAEGHFDILMVLAITTALLAISKKWYITCGIAMGIAIGVKIMAVVIAPLILWRTGYKGILAALIALILPLVFYHQDLSNMLHGLREFGTHGAFNGPIHQLLTSALHIDPLQPQDTRQLSLIIVSLYAICCLIAFTVMLRGKLWAATLIALGGLILFSPVVHFWYLSWLLPLVALRPRLSWVILSLSASLYFLVWHQFEMHQSWDLPSWAKWAFWLPFFIVLAAENVWVIRKLRFKRKPSSLSHSPTISIVIPTYNPDPASLQRTLTSIASQTLPAHEIIIADASIDKRATQIPSSSHPPLHTISTPKGRGLQIKLGVESATGEWVIVVHSDSTLPPDAIAHLHKAIVTNPDLIGGAFGQRFTSNSPGLLLIEVMNEFRATLHHTSFGDQNQFFHRQTAINHHVLTEQPLMEDVEISDRLNKIGDTLYLGKEGRVSAEKWLTGNFPQRFRTIIEFCLKYRLLFYSRKKRLALSQQFYQRYYGE